MRELRVRTTTLIGASVLWFAGKGLKDDDAWQKAYLKPGSTALREIEFWEGE